MNVPKNRAKNKKGSDRDLAPGNKLNLFQFVIIFTFVAIFVFPRISAAYLDPGTGSFVFQMIIAGFVGALYTIKTYWRNIKKIFKKDSKE